MVARPPVARRSGCELLRDHQQVLHAVPRGLALPPSSESHPVAHSPAITIMCCVLVVTVVRKAESCTVNISTGFVLSGELIHDSNKSLKDRAMNFPVENRWAERGAPDLIEKVGSRPTCTCNPLRLGGAACARRLTFRMEDHRREG